MEFLDPAAKKARTIRLFIGYALLAVVVALATTILVYQAQGFGYDRDKGVTRNGLLFINAKPSQATITMDGQEFSNKTDTRMTLLEGSHTIKLNVDKYREWTKQFNIEGGEVKYLQYPVLFPKDIPLGITRVLPASPTLVSQTPDRHWLIYQETANSGVIKIVDLLKPNDDPLIETLSTAVLPIEKGSRGTLKAVEWSDDNRHLLLSQTLPSGAINYIQFDRENVDQSINLTIALKLTADQVVSLLDKKFDKFYLFSESRGELRTATTKNNEVSNPVLTGVVAFKPHGDNLIYYVTYEGAKPNEANLEVLSDLKNKTSLKPIARDASNKYLLEVTKFNGTWIYAVGAPSKEFVYLYRNPLSRASANTATQAPPQVSLRISNPQYISFSDNARFLAIQSGKQFVVYDSEDTRIFRYEVQLNIGLAQQAKWMDGHRITVNSDGRVYVFDFDGSNTQNLVASQPGFEPYFDRDFNYMYTFVKESGGKIGFQSAQLIL
jgi:hypothetical protein